MTPRFWTGYTVSAGLALPTLLARYSPARRERFSLQMRIDDVVTDLASL